MTTIRPRHLVRRNASELDALAITPRQIERWTHDGHLGRIQPSGPTGPALTDGRCARQLRLRITSLGQEKPSLHIGYSNW